MDSEQGEAAVESIRYQSNNLLSSSNITFHELDVRDREGVASLAEFIHNTYGGKLDILVNNAAVTGLVADEEGLRALNIAGETWISGRAASLIQDVLVQTHEQAVNCIATNYYGYKQVTEALLPLLKRSTSGARIVNVTSIAAELKVVVVYTHFILFLQELKCKMINSKVVERGAPDGSARGGRLGQAAD